MDLLLPAAPWTDFALCRETEFFALTNAASWLQPYGKFFMVSLPLPGGRAGQAYTSPMKYAYTLLDSEQILAAASAHDFIMVKTLLAITGLPPDAEEVRRCIFC